jgi:hypothetical protein
LSTLTHRELEDLIGRKLGAKVVMVRRGDELWHRLEDGRWERYPDYPPPLPEKMA